MLLIRQSPHRTEGGRHARLFSWYDNRMTRRFAAVLTMLLLVPTISSAAITADLKYGATGSQVRELQQFLIDQKILVGVPTGNFYSITLQGVKLFQKIAGLPQTGFVGPMTRAEINVRLLASGTPPATTTAPFVSAAAFTAASSSDPQVAALNEQIKKLLAALQPTQSTSSIVQVYNTTPEPFDFNQYWRSAVVNLFCTDRYGGGLSSGSGVIIDPRGIILTNAHVAMDFLFQDWPNPSLTECTVRTGSPASPSYKAKLLYFPQGYVTDTVNAIPGASDDTFVYGKDDYAILWITGPSSPQAPMPSSFPFLAVNFAVTPVNTPVYLLGYASEYSSYETLQRNLYQLASPAKVDSLRQIQGSGKVDAIAFNGNVVGQHGSSGGAVVLNGGQLAGLMSFFDKGEGKTTGEKVLNAITTGYIARDFETDTTVPLVTFLNNDAATLAQRFASTSAPVYQAMFKKYWKSRGQTVPGIYD